MIKEQANLILDQVKVGVPYPAHIINQALTITGDINGQILSRQVLQNNTGSIPQYRGVWGGDRETIGENVYKGWNMRVLNRSDRDFIRHVYLETVMDAAKIFKQSEEATQNYINDPVNKLNFQLGYLKGQIEELCEMVQIQREEIQKLEIELSGEKEWKILQLL